MNTNLQGNAIDWPGAAATLEGSAALDASDIMTRLYRESRRGACSALAAAGEVPDCLRLGPVAAGKPRVALPAPEAASRSLQQSLGARTAVRTFDADPISLCQLGTMLRSASDGDVGDWPDEEAAGVGLQLMVVAWRVQGLAPAIWRYEAGTHALAYVGAAPAPDEASTLTLQVEFTTAPALVFITGGLAAACARFGSFGHRQLLLRGGAAGQRLWLSAIGVGLAGSVFAGFLPRAADRFAAIDGYLQANLLAFAAGYPAGPAQRHDALTPKGGATHTRVP